MILAKIERVILILWVVIALSPSLGTAVLPYLSWLATLPLATIILINSKNRSEEFTFPLPVLLSSVFLTIAVLIVAVIGDQTIYDLSQFAKLFLILLVIIPLIISSYQRRSALWIGAECTVFLNFVLIVGGITFNPALFGIQGFARFGTYTASPGALWRVGALGITAAVLAGNRGSRFAKARCWFCGLVSFALIALDGSRTGLLVLAFAGVLYTPRLLSSFKGAKGLGVAVVVLIAVFMSSVSLNDSNDEGEGQFGVVSRLQKALSGETSVSVDSLDTTRAEMYRRVFSEVKDHPLFGTGMGTTSVQTTIGMMVVHCSFLQLWADVGLLGFGSYLFLTFTVLAMALMKARRATYSSEYPSLQAIYIAGGWILAGFFHPISTEITEWVWFALGLTMVISPFRVAADQAGSTLLTCQS